MKTFGELQDAAKPFISKMGDEIRSSIRWSETIIMKQIEEGTTTGLLKTHMASKENQLSLLESITTMSERLYAFPRDEPAPFLTQLRFKATNIVAASFNMHHTRAVGFGKKDSAFSVSVDISYLARGKGLAFTKMQSVSPFMNKETTKMYSMIAFLILQSKLREITLEEFVDLVAKNKGQLSFAESTNKHCTVKGQIRSINYDKRSGIIRISVGESSFTLVQDMMEKDCIRLYLECESDVLVWFQWGLLSPQRVIHIMKR